MPPANVIVFTDTMVTSSVGAHTMDCPPTSTPSYASFYSGDNKRHSSSSNTDDNDVDLNADICPRHFTDIHRTKLEDTFSRKQKPDDIQLQIIAMECNLLYKDVRDWFKARRIKWIEELVRSESTEECTMQKNSKIYKNDNDNNNNNNNISNNNISVDTTTMNGAPYTKKIHVNALWYCKHSTTNNNNNIIHNNNNNNIHIEMSKLNIKKVPSNGLTTTRLSNDQST